jgi:glycerate dehydrogenase
MNIVVLDGFAADQGHVRWSALSEYGTLTVHPRTGSGEVLPRARDADALLTNKVVLGRDTLEELPRLRYVGIIATGTNVVDLSLCRDRGIAVTNVPGYSTMSVAQLVFALTLHFTHDVAGHDAKVKSGGWAESPDFMFSLQPLTELAGKTIAIVGLGAIGRAVSDMARAFGMRVIAAAVPGSSSEGRVPLDDALAASDIVTLHCPLTRATHRLVSSAFLRKMKRGALLINTGRGALVDETALAHALAEGALGGAALDVLESEPPAAGHPLLDPKAPWAKRIVITPHLGWATVEARQRLVAAVVENLGAFVRGEQKNRVEQEITTLSVLPL